MGLSLTHLSVLQEQQAFPTVELSSPQQIPPKRLGQRSPSLASPPRQLTAVAHASNHSSMEMEAIQNLSHPWLDSRLNAILSHIRPAPIPQISAS